LSQKEFINQSSAKEADLALAKDYTRRLRERLGGNLLSVTLYGSRARGDAKVGSDFDLVVKVRQSSSDIREKVLATDVEMMNEFETLFVGMVYDEAEWKRTEQFPFGWNVAREGVTL
jgi:predicted nucleotidyltransferase